MIWRQIFITAMLAGCASWALAQNTAPANDPPANETLEPAVNTSAPAQSEKPAEPPSQPSAPATKPSGPQTKTGTRTGKAPDRLELDTTQITGNRELPKVLYIVPWKRSDLGDLLGRPVNSLLDEVLAPVDRDVFKRENRYYRALQPDAAAAAPTSAPAAKPASAE